MHGVHFLFFFLDGTCLSEAVLILACDGKILLEAVGFFFACSNILYNGIVLSVVKGVHSLIFIVMENSCSRLLEFHAFPNVLVQLDDR